MKKTADQPPHATAVERSLQAIGLSVRQAREKRGLTQEQLATLAGLTRPVVNEIENAATNYRAGSLVRLYLVLGLRFP